MYSHMRIVHIAFDRHDEFFRQPEQYKHLSGNKCIRNAHAESETRTSTHTQKKEEEDTCKQQQ